MDPFPWPSIGSLAPRLINLMLTCVTLNRYKMSYYNYQSLFPAGQAADRVRGVRLPQKGPVLNTLEEAYTSENWIIRIYKVKDLDNVGRNHIDAAAFDRGQKKKAIKKKGPRILRVD